MPMHDWTRVDAGLFHHFHGQWIVSLCNALNGSTLPAGFVALAEQTITGPIPDVLTLQKWPDPVPRPETNGGGAVAVAEHPPQARFVIEGEEDVYARRVNRVRVQHRHGQVVAVIEVVSPGNKNSRHAIRSFVDKAFDLIRQGVHLLVVDPFPPSARDPQGLHKLIWDEISVQPFELPPDKPLTVAAYQAAMLKRAFVDPIAVGDELPSLPIFLNERLYVPAPLEASYRTSWEFFPRDFKGMLEGPPGAS